MIAPRRVLLVDDEMSLMRALRRIVQGAAPDSLVVYSSDVPSAIDQMETTTLCLVVTDLNMNGDADAGWRVVAAAKTAGVPVLVLTGSTEPDLAARASAAAVPLVTKGPLAPKAIEAMVVDSFAVHTRGPAGGEGASVERAMR